MRKLRTGPLVGLVLVLAASGAMGQEPGQRSGSEARTPHPEAREAIGELRSPFCPGLMLEVCPSPQAAELRDSIQTLAESGMESDSIVEWMLATYGEEWRAVPRTEGKGIWAWVMPPAALVLGFVVVALALRKFRARSRESGHAKRTISPDEEARLDEAIRELEEAESEDALL